jgi:hypothetical protein
MIHLQEALAEVRTDKPRSPSDQEIHVGGRYRTPPRFAIRRVAATFANFGLEIAAYEAGEAVGKCGPIDTNYCAVILSA